MHRNFKIPMHEMILKLYVLTEMNNLKILSLCRKENFLKCLSQIYSSRVLKLEKPSLKLKPII